MSRRLTDKFVNSINFSLGINNKNKEKITRKSIKISPILKPKIAIPKPKDLENKNTNKKNENTKNDIIFKTWLNNLFVIF